MFFFSSRRTTHAQINHVITNAVKTTPVLTEEHAPNCATTLNASSTAHARLNIMANFVRRKLQHLVSSFKSWRRIWKSLLYTLWMIQPASRCSKLLWFHFWKWIRLDFAPVLQLSQQQTFQGSTILQRLPSEPELFQVEQISPVTADNEFNAEPFYALPSNLQL